MGDAGFPSLRKLFPQLAGSSYFRERDTVMELAWVDGRPEMTPHTRRTAAAPQQMPSGCPVFPATTTWSRPIVRARGIDEEASAAAEGVAAMEAAPAASMTTPGSTPAAAQPLQPSGSSGRAGHKRPREQLLEAGDAGASGAAGRRASPAAMLPGVPSSLLSRVEHVSYATNLMTYDDTSVSSHEYDDEDYGDDTSLGPRDDSGQPANDQDDSAGRSRSVRAKKKRRDKFNQLLKTIIPNTNKSDAVSILDSAIDHLKKLQSLAEMVGIIGGNP